MVEEYEIAYKEFRLQTFTSILDVVSNIFSGNITCLDIGCASGWFLQTAAERDWECFGIDISKDFIQRASLNVPLGRFEIGEFSKKTFEGVPLNVITLLDVLEHIEDPFTTLRLIWERLESRGLLVVRVPVIDSVMLYLSKLIYVVTLGKYVKPLNLLYQYHFSFR